MTNIVLKAPLNSNQPTNLWPLYMYDVRYLIFWWAIVGLYASGTTGTVIWDVQSCEICRLVLVFMCHMVCDKKMFYPHFCLPFILTVLLFRWEIQAWVFGLAVHLLVVYFMPTTLFWYLSPVLTVEALWADIGRNGGVLKRVVGHFERKFSREWRSPTDWCRPWAITCVVCVILRLVVVIQYRRVTDKTPGLFIFLLFHPFHSTRIVPLHFQAGCRRRRLNLSSVLCELIWCYVYF